MGKIAFTAMAVFFITLNIFSQSTKKFIDTVSVKNQFEYLIDESNSYQDYKVVKTSWLTKLKSNVIDSLSDSKKKVSDNHGMLNSQKQLIDSLKIKLSDSKTAIANLNAEKESISFIGIQFEKSAFKTLMLVIIGILIILLLFFITKFRQSNSVTQQTRLSLKETESEFETYRTKALEREQRAMRKLQDELNKNKKE